MDDKLETIWKEDVEDKSRYYIGICLEGLRHKTKTKSHDGQLSTQIPVEYTHIYKAEAVTLTGASGAAIYETT
jgi:hypothetical protein